MSRRTWAYRWSSSAKAPRLRPIQPYRPSASVRACGLLPHGANDGLLAAPMSYSRSFGDRRRWASRARASAAEAP
jgi:hypothetical protein